MRIAWTVCCVFLIGVQAVGGEQGVPTGRGLAAAAQMTGSVEGVVTAHTTSPGGDSITIGTIQMAKMPTIELSLGAATIFYVMPIEGQPIKLAYQQIQGGELKRFTWLADSPVLFGKSVKAAFTKGVATEVSLYPSCTRERCMSNACNRKCKASSCVCPKTEKAQ